MKTRMVLYIQKTSLCVGKLSMRHLIREKTIFMYELVIVNARYCLAASEVSV